jgi:hypothetical protein
VEPVRRRTFLLGIAGLLGVAGGVTAAPSGASAQARRSWRVGFLSGGARPPDEAPPPALRQALRQLGYVEGQNVTYVGR